MYRQLGFFYGALLVVLPLAAFLAGPAVSWVAPDELPDPVLLSVLPTVLPLVALASVGALAYRWTASVSKTFGLVVLALVVALVGAVVYLAASWPTES